MTEHGESARQFGPFDSKFPKAKRRGRRDAEDRRVIIHEVCREPGRFRSKVFDRVSFSPITSFLFAVLCVLCVSFDPLDSHVRGNDLIPGKFTFVLVPLGFSAVHLVH